jgi:chemotaxis protein MotB
MPFFPRRMLALALLAGSLVATTGCVSTSEYKSVQANLQEAQRSIAEMQNDIIGYNKKISDLKAEVDRLNALIAVSKDGVGGLQRERDLLAQRLKDLQAKLDDLLAKGPGTAIRDPETNTALRDLAAQFPDLLDFDEKLGMIRFKSDMTFDLGSTDVKPRAKDALAVLAKILNRPEIAQNEIRVVGHTDDVPIRKMAGQLSPDNWYLSTNRAHSVLAVLRTDGITEARGQAAGWGEQRPIAPNAAGKRGNEANRRVEIYVLPTLVPDGITISTPGGGPVRTPRPLTPPAPATRAAPVGDMPR